MILKIDGKFAVCYSNREVFKGGFNDRDAALEYYFALRPVDRMLVNGVPPGEKTDRGFLYGTENGKQFEGKEYIGDYYKGVADKSNVSINGKKYISQLARFPGDPEAWVSGRGDIQRICEERGYNCEGSVNVKAMKEVVPQAPKPLADDIIRREVAKKVKAHGGKVSKKKLENFRDDVLTKHTRKKG